MYYVGSLIVGEECLCHHGILGQKWGVRRFQNKDGSLTDAGLARYREIARQSRDDPIISSARKKIDSAKKTAGIYSESDNNDVIQKGAKIYRITDTQETVDGRRKYASLIESDVNDYKNLSDLLPYEHGGADRRKETYEAKKDLKVANAINVSKYLLDKYGDRKIKDLEKDPELKKYGLDITKYELKEIGKAKVKDFSELFKNADELNAIYSHTFSTLLTNGQSLSKEDKSELSRMHNLALTGKRLLMAFMATEMYGKTKGKDLTDYFSRKGYDAMVDIEDVVGHCFQYPVIFLNPGESMKKIKSEKI